MLVMSLSLLLGHAIPELAETTEILVFPRRGSRSDGLGVPKPHEQNKPRDPPRTLLGARGALRGVTGARVWRTFASDRRSGIALCVLFCPFLVKLGQISEISRLCWVSGGVPSPFSEDFLPIFDNLFILLLPV